MLCQGIVHSLLSRLFIESHFHTVLCVQYDYMYFCFLGDSLATEVKGHSHKANINVKAAFIHVVGDLLQSVGVLCAAFIIYFKVKLLTLSLLVAVVFAYA